MDVTVFQNCKTIFCRMHENIINWRRKPLIVNFWLIFVIVPNAYHCNILKMKMYQINLYRLVKQSCIHLLQRYGLFIVFFFHHWWNVIQMKNLFCNFLPIIEINEKILFIPVDDYPSIVTNCLHVANHWYFQSRRKSQLWHLYLFLNIR